MVTKVQNAHIQTVVGADPLIETSALLKKGGVGC